MNRPFETAERGGDTIRQHRTDGYVSRTAWEPELLAARYAGHAAALPCGDSLPCLSAKKPLPRPRAATSWTLRMLQGLDDACRRTFKNIRTLSPSLYH